MKLLGLGNGIVDLLIRVEDDFLARHHLKKGSVELVDADTQQKLLTTLKDSPAKIACGGSVVNSICLFAAATPADSAGVITCLGQDDLSNHYADNLKQLGVIHADNIFGSEQATGSCLVLVTPDGERTMQTCLAATTEISAVQGETDFLANADYVFVEGYLFATDSAVGLIDSVTSRLGPNQKLALTLSAEFIVEVFRSRVEAILPKVDLLFANESEAKSLCGEGSPAKAAMAIAAKYQIAEVVVTAGSDGAYYYNLAARELRHQPTIVCEPSDLTGAGDAFAAGFFKGLQVAENTDKNNAAIALKYATVFSHQVITTLGARSSAITAEFPQPAGASDSVVVS